MDTTKINDEIAAMIDGALGFVVPAHLEFAALDMVADGDQVSLWWPVVAEICAASGIKEQVVRDGPPIILPLLLRGWVELLRDRALLSADAADQANVMVSRMIEQATAVMTGADTVARAISVRLGSPVLH